MNNNKICEKYVFHYTNKENLLSILKEGFRWCSGHEDIPYKEEFEGVVITGQNIYRICFCVIPLSLAKNHRKTYGDYAIGLTKDWAYKMQISPVKYAHKNTKAIVNMKQYPDLSVRLSDARGNVDQFLKGLYSTWKDKGEIGIEDPNNISIKEEKLGNLIVNLISYISLDVMPFIRNEDFYEEMEWRAVLETRDMGDKNDNLVFCFSDISLILVPNEDDKKEFFETIRDAEKKMYNGTYSDHISDHEIEKKNKNV